VSALSDIEARLRNLAADALPVIHDGAVTLEHLAQSKIVAELQVLAAPLDPALEAAIAAIIRAAGEAAAKIAALTVPEAAVPVGLDAEPEPPA
jgi:hypothetical protein